MAGRRFDVADVVEVLRLWDAGKSNREIARSTGMGRNRVAAITKKASAAFARGAERVLGAEWGPAFGCCWAAVWPAGSAINSSGSRSSMTRSSSGWSTAP